MEKSRIAAVAMESAISADDLALALLHPLAASVTEMHPLAGLRTGLGSGWLVHDSASQEALFEVNARFSIH
jgi:hypothetical protein